MNITQYNPLSISHILLTQDKFVPTSYDKQLYHHGCEPYSRTVNRQLLVCSSDLQFQYKPLSRFEKSANLRSTVYVGIFTDKEYEN